jgi:FixJ family two-component response regulator
MADHPRNFVIAVVDDDRRVLESLAELLESAGYAVRLFASAAALLERDNLVEFDCLISDIDLPRIDGFELLHLLHTARPELPVVLITGHPELADRSSPISRGCCRLFRKPFDAQELLAAVSDAVQNPRQPCRVAALPLLPQSE